MPRCPRRAAASRRRSTASPPAKPVTDLASAAPGAIDFRLAVRPFAQQIVVTPTRGTGEDTSRVPQAATLVDRSALESRPYTIVTQALKEEAGVLAQQTTASQGSPVLRGFTGQRNLYLIDGVRYNTAAWRDGPSQYLAWLPAADVDRIEIVRGPASAQYGSDALGGTIGVFAPALNWPRSIERARHARRHGRRRESASHQRRGARATRATAWRCAARPASAPVDDLRAGDDVDSHSAVTRFLGIPSSEVGDKLENTGYSHAGIFGGRPASAWREPQPGVLVSAQRSGRCASLRSGDRRQRPLSQRVRAAAARLRFRAIRKRAPGRFFDGVSATVSVNRQADGRLEQARPGQRIDEQVNTTTALGYSLQATRDWSARFRTLVGGEIFDEDIAGSRTFHEPDGSTVRARPDIPGRHAGTGRRDCSSSRAPI